jgi:hypothetical protein
MPYLFESKPVISDHFTVLGVNNARESQKKLKKMQQDKQSQAISNLPKLKPSATANRPDYGMNKASVFD